MPRDSWQLTLTIPLGVNIAAPSGEAQAPVGGLTSQYRGYSGVQTPTSSESMPFQMLAMQIARSRSAPPPRAPGGASSDAARTASGEHGYDR